MDRPESVIGAIREVVYTITVHISSFLVRKFWHIMSDEFHYLRVFDYDSMSWCTIESARESKVGPDVCRWKK